MSLKTTLGEVEPYITKDGSEIRELLHPNQHAVRRQSLAEAVIPPGVATLRHRHAITEEIYHITQGEGLMRLGDATFAVRTGDTIVIPPGTAHNITNASAEPLKILCACQPAYSHEDTELLPTE